ncbi:hypothetical protein [Burkholderia diffusa]|uniref:hypothetical protein n=1 Tax=Burkholderia diffusa TaxID=488732 RepID=UPI000AF2C96F|nr:hypothetical protein [Burkholderia diffusa]
MVIGWISSISLALTYWWIRHPDLAPAPPLAFSLWLDRLFSAHDCESSANVDIYYAFVVSVLVASLLTFVCCRIFGRINRSRLE